MTSSPSSPDPQKNESFKDKFKASLHDLQTNEKLEQIAGLATSNTRDTVSYIALIIGIILLFFQPLYGGILIGFIVGIYFSSELLALFKHISDLIDAQGIVRSLIAGGFLLALLISCPALFIGLAIAVALRQIVFPAP